MLKTHVKTIAFAMKINELTDEQLERLIEVLPQWVSRMFPKWTYRNHAEDMYRYNMRWMVWCHPEAVLEKYPKIFLEHFQSEMAEEEREHP